MSDSPKLMYKFNKKMSLVFILFLSRQVDYKVHLETNNNNVGIMG